MQNPRIRFESLAEKLSKGGIAPKHVRRYIAELKDHADDLVRAGVSEAQAWTQLGSEDHLAQEMLKREDLKTLGARYPRTFFGAGPAAALLLSYVVAVLFMAGIVFTSRWVVGDQAEEVLFWYRPLIDTYCAAVKFGMPVVVGIAFTVLTARGQVTLQWLLVGLAIIAFCGASADLSVVWPEIAGGKKELQIGFGFGWASPPFLSATDTLTRSLINLVMMTPGLARVWWQGRSIAIH